jgi:hypothetical protein
MSEEEESRKVLKIRREMHDPNNPVSIQIAQGATKGEVLRLLPEVTQVLLEEDWHRLQEWDGGLRPKFPRDLLG